MHGLDCAPVQTYMMKMNEWGYICLRLPPIQHCLPKALYLWVLMFSDEGHKCVEQDLMGAFVRMISNGLSLSDKG